MSRAKRNTHSRHRPRKRAIQYSRDICAQPRSRGVLDTPLEPVIGLAEGETRWRGMTESVKRYPALTAFLRHARCTAQEQPGGCDDTSLAGAADDGASVGIASFTRRSCA